MKARIIKTKVWTDRDFHKLSADARYVFMYLLSCQYVGMSNYFECLNAYMQLETGLSQVRVEKAQEELMIQKKAFFYDGWVLIPNLEKHNQYKNSPRNLPTYEKEINDVPKSVLDYFDSISDTSIDTSMPTSRHSDLKSEIKNHKSKTEIEGGMGEGREKSPEYLMDIPEEDYQGLMAKLNVTKSDVRRKGEALYLWVQSSGKRRKNYRAVLRGALIKDFGYTFKE